MVFLFAAIFGLITALIIKCFLSTKVPEEDEKKMENKVESKVEKSEWIETDKNPPEKVQSVKYKLEMQDSYFFEGLDDENDPLYYDVFGSNVQALETVSYTHLTLPTILLV